MAEVEEQIDQESLIIQLRTAFLKQNLGKSCLRQSHPLAKFYQPIFLSPEPYDSRDISRVRNDDRVVLAYLKNCRFNREKAFNMMVGRVFLSVL